MQKRITYYLVALLVVILASAMSWIGYGQDIEFHAERVVALAAEMKNGPGIYRIYTTVCEGYGYASPMFYGDIFLYPAAALVAMGMPLAIAFRMLLASTVIAAFLSMYCCVKAVCGGEQAAFTAYVYAFSPVVLSDTFIRYALGTSLAYVFLPIVLFGFYRIVIEPKNRRWDWIILSMGMSGLILSHIISTVLVLILLVFLCLIFARRIWRNKSTILSILLAAVLTAALTSYFAFPMLEQMATSSFLVNARSDAFVYRTAPVYSLLFGSEYLNLLNVLIEKLLGPEYRMSVIWFPGAYGYMLFVVVWARIFRKREVKSKALDLCLALSVIYLILSIVPNLEVFYKPIARLIQFPWRNLMFYMVFLSLAAGMVMAKLQEKGENRLVQTGMLFAIASMLICVAGLAMSTWHNGLFSYQDLSTDSVGLGEYLPASVPSYDYSTIRGETVWCSDDALAYEFCRGNGYSELRFSETAEDTLFEVPVYMYKGYAVVDEDTGENFEPYVSENGLVEFLIPQDHEGTVKIYYKGTTVQYVSCAISLVTILALCVAFLFVKRKKGK